MTAYADGFWMFVSRHHILLRRHRSVLPTHCGVHSQFDQAWAPTSKCDRAVVTDARTGVDPGPHAIRSLADCDKFVGNI